MKGIVYKSTGSWYQVRDEQGRMCNARIKGKLKIEGITSTNPVAVGDIVTVEMENELEQTLTILSVDDRRNCITRTSPHNKNQHHIIAANIDQTLLFATLRQPRTSQGFIDRFLITAEAYHVPAILVFNKSDLYREKEQEQLAEWKQMFEAIGYRVCAMSLETGEGVEEVKQLLKNHCTLLSGHSGVGKSSFINQVVPELQLRTQDVSDWSGKGLHTTTFAEMFDLDNGGRIIDTPGIRELGLVDISRQELSHYFPEMRQLIGKCQFNNCQHLNEPGCAVKQAVQAGSIHPDRYVSYCNILESIPQNSW